MANIVKRHELKYLISSQDHIVLTKKLEHILQRDHYSKFSPYIITSLYYDDIFNTGLKQKVDGDSYRYKYRVRYYNKSHNLFKLEKKEKIHTITNKQSTLLSESEVSSLINNEFEFLLHKNDDLCTEFYYKLHQGLLKPKVIVEYQRVAYIHKAGNLRVTFDTNLRSSLTNHNIFSYSKIYTKPLSEDEIVMEVKFNGEIPSYIKSI
jgi:hypothetical protein